MWSIFLLLIMPALGQELEFPPYVPSEQYKCGAFLKGRVDDQALSYYYQAIDQFIAAISNPFPHQELLSKKALTGDVDALRDSLENKYTQWATWDQTWLVIAGGLIAVSVVFPFFYILYRCCVCCCGSDPKKASTDGRFDGCKRNFLNILVAVLILIDVFAAATLLVTGQYAEYGLEELPNRLNHCVDDLNLYKRDTDMKVRKLLIDDYKVLNRSVVEQLSHAGRDVVSRIKKATGAHAIDVFMNISENAQEVQSVLRDIRSRVDAVNEDALRFQVELGRLRKTASDELRRCLRDEPDALKQMCQKGERLLESLSQAQLHFDMDMLSPENEAALSRLIESNLTEMLQGSNSQFVDMERQLQQQIDAKVFSAQGILMTIADDLFAVAEGISTQIRQINFDVLYNVINAVADPKQGDVRRYVHYSWYVSLVLTSIFILISLCFLFGLFYGWCGRRPTFYNDDCCVRSTGSRFYGCGIWLSVFLLVFLSAACAVLMLSVGNASHLVCHSWRDPLARPDVMSLVDRYLEIYKENDAKSQQWDQLLSGRTPDEIIRACERNETFYQFLGLDEKYRLNELKDRERAAYEQLEQYLQQTLAQLPVKRSFDAFVSERELSTLESLSTMNFSHISEPALQKLKLSIHDIDLLSRSDEFKQEIAGLPGGQPRAISSVLEQLEALDTQIARPLRKKLETLHGNLTAIDDRLADMQVPVGSLVVKLQHAQALLAGDIKTLVETAANDVMTRLKATFEQYVDHVKKEMMEDVSSCAPIAAISRNSRAAVCDHTINPLNGSWMSMLICVVCTVPIVIITTTLISLYNKMHEFPKYIVHEPAHDLHNMNSFITDTYDIRHKPNYNYSYADEYQRTYR